MRSTGTIIEWNDDRGFGFIEPADGGRVFCHVKAFEVRVRRPMAGDRVTYEVVTGPDGRTRAERVRPVDLEEASYNSNIRTKPLRERERVEASTRISWVSRLIPVLLVGVLAYYAFQHSSQYRSASNVPVDYELSTRASQSDDAIGQAFNQHRSNVQVQGSGVVDRVLPDDTDGSRHQRFILRLASGQTVLIAHNIDLAPRVASLVQGDRVDFSGEYEWNNQGGVVHWTHRDPQDHHAPGWIKHHGNTYQ